MSGEANNFTEKTAAIKRERDELIKTCNPRVPVRLLPTATVPPKRARMSSNGPSNDPLSLSGRVGKGFFMVCFVMERLADERTYKRKGKVICGYFV